MQGAVGLLNTVTYPPGASQTQARIVIDGVRGAIFEYVAGGPLGALASSWASSAGTDPYGNVYPEGFSAGSGSVFESGSTIVNSKGVFVYNGTPAKNNMIASIAGNTGTDQFGNDYLNSTTVYQFISPSLNRWAATTMYGSVRNTYLTPGADQVGYANTGGSETFFNDQWTMQAQTGATLVSDNAQVQRFTSGLTGQIPLDQVNANFFTNANLAGTQPATATYTIPANDALVAGVTYEIEAEFTGTFENQTLAMGHQINGAAVGGVPQYPVLAAGFFTAGTSFTGWIKTTLRIISTGAGGSCIVFDKGDINQSGANLSSAGVGGTGLTGRQVSIAFNTTIANTLAIGCLWGGSTAGQTITYYGSVFRRRGK